MGSKSQGGPQTPRRYRDDGVLELVDMGADHSAIRTALLRCLRALDNAERRRNTAHGKFRQAQLRENQLALEMRA